MTQRSAAQAGLGPPPRPVGRPAWESLYAFLLVVVVAVAVAVTTASALALALWFGDQQASVGGEGPSVLTGVSYVTVVALAAPAWVAVLAASRAYESRYLGIGSDEFKRVAGGPVRFAALWAVTG